ncbi:putative Josephin [Blattamonas nauphoetae]|uniref:ubiquitinyl hydrolase 1 n=1 Tax=Blattamonas nauphoetae TaxID=2049346 RepID=A0ABQ9XKS6_9EUKA|nr:putative Josephin [Blattamonas nauphoetae]
MTIQPTVFREEQKRQLCAIHSLNNLMQRRVASKDDFDEIASSLSDCTTPWSKIFRHKTPFVGNYDADTVQFALFAASLPYSFFPHTKHSLRAVDIANSSGMIINWSMGDSSNHWVCFRRIQGRWFNLDSLADTHSSYRSAEQCVRYINQQLRECPRSSLVILITCPERELDTVSYFFYSNTPLCDATAEEKRRINNEEFKKRNWTYLKRAKVVTQLMEPMRARWEQERQDRLKEAEAIRQREEDLIRQQEEKEMEEARLLEEEAKKKEEEEERLREEEDRKWEAQHNKRRSPPLPSFFDHDEDSPPIDPNDAIRPMGSSTKNEDSDKTDLHTEIDDPRDLSDNPADPTHTDEVPVEDSHKHDQQIGETKIEPDEESQSDSQEIKAYNQEKGDHSDKETDPVAPDQVELPKEDDSETSQSEDFQRNIDL